LHIQQSSHARQKTLSKGGVSGEDMRKAAGLNVIDEQRSVVLRKSLDKRSISM